MKVILAIDLKNGKVVKAFAGLRLNYKPLVLNLMDYSNPLKLIKKVSEELFIFNIYIADLDAIQNIGNNEKKILKILKEFPKLKFFIDSGFDYPQSVWKFNRRFYKNKIKNFKLVLGTEKLKRYNLRCFSSSDKFFISLDIKFRDDKWVSILKSSKSKPNLIFMFLKNVGGRGVSFKNLRKLIRKLPGHSYHYAGGVKYPNQLRMLKNLGVESTIVSTLVHKKIEQSTINANF